MLGFLCHKSMFVVVLPAAPLMVTATAEDKSTGGGCLDPAATTHKVPRLYSAVFLQRMFQIDALACRLSKPEAARLRVGPC